MVSRTGPNSAAIVAESLRQSSFILVSNDRRLTAPELLKAYNTQCVVEQDNALVKGPLAVAPLFLKNTKKITAYVYVVLMALLLWRCMQSPQLAYCNTATLLNPTRRSSCYL